MVSQVQGSPSISIEQYKYKIQQNTNITNSNLQAKTNAVVNPQVVNGNVVTTNVDNNSAINKNTQNVQNQSGNNTQVTKTNQNSNNNNTNNIKNLQTIISGILNDDNYQIEISKDKDTNKLVFKVLDSKTGQVIRQYPPDIALKVAKIAQALQQNGNLTNAKV